MLAAAAVDLNVVGGAAAELGSVADRPHFVQSPSVRRCLLGQL